MDLPSRQTSTMSLASVPAASAQAVRCASFQHTGKQDGGMLGW